MTIFAALYLTTSVAQGTPSETAQPPVTEANSKESGSAEKIKASSAEIQHELNICRSKSVIRFAEAPDLYIDDMKVAEVSNGTHIVHRVNPNATFSLKTKANPFLYRFKDELLVRGTLIEPMFIVVKAERNLSQGLTLFFGGAIAEATRQSIEVGESKNWTTSIVSLNEFVERCNE